MIVQIMNIVIGEIQRVAQQVAVTPGSFAAYVDLTTMRAGDAVAFWLEYDVGGINAPRAAGSVISIAYEDIAQEYDNDDEQIIVNAAWALEPVMLEINQVSRIAFSQTAGTPRNYTVRNTRMDDGS